MIMELEILKHKMDLMERELKNSFLETCDAYGIGRNFANILYDVKYKNELNQPILPIMIQENQPFVIHPFPMMKRDIEIAPMNVVG